MRSPRGNTEGPLERLRHVFSLMKSLIVDEVIQEFDIVTSGRSGVFIWQIRKDSNNFCYVIIKVYSSVSDLYVVIDETGARQLQSILKIYMVQADPGADGLLPEGPGFSLKELLIRDEVIQEFDVITLAGGGCFVWRIRKDSCNLRYITIESKGGDATVHVPIGATVAKQLQTVVETYLAQAGSGADGPRQ